MEIPVCVTSGRSQIATICLLLTATLGGHAQSVPGSVADTQCADGSWHTGYYNCGANGNAPASNSPRPPTREEIEARNRDVANRYNAAGNAATVKKDYATAIADYQTAISLYHGGFAEYVTVSTFRANLATALNNQADLALQRGDYAAALAGFQAALQAYPNNNHGKTYKTIKNNIVIAQQALAAQQAPPPPVQVAAAPPAAPPAAALVRIGGAGEVHGTVYQLLPDGQKVPITPGTPVYAGEHIGTGADGHVEFFLLDETKFTVGAGSDMVLDDFVYAPETSAGKVTARLIEGIFRFVSGKVARQGPDRVGIDIPTGTIGIRGTEIEVQVNPDNSGSIKLFSGHMDVTENKSGSVLSMDAGQMVTFSADGTFSQPGPMNQ